MPKTTTQLFRSDEARRRHLRIALLKSDTQAKDVAAACGVSPALVSMVMAGDRRHPKVERLLASLSGLTPAQLWPPRSQSPFGSRKKVPPEAPSPKRAHVRA